jgi:hypothetical protein
MNPTAFQSGYLADSYPHAFYSALGLLLLLVGCSAVFAQDASSPTASPFSAHATHLLGFEGARGNAGGTLSIEGDALQFQKSGKPAVEIKIASVRDVVLGEQSKQVGGLPMTLGTAAVPYGGGRVVSLFAHKKYDTLTLEYGDANGGFHGAIFQMNKRQGTALRDQLAARGVHVTSNEIEPAKQSTAEVARESK